MWLLLVGILVGAASAYTIQYRLGEGTPGLLAYDTYGYYYPHMLYALRSLRAGGGGLLWNPFQNCGQPFLGITETGLFYPVNLLFLFLAPQMALRGLLLVNMTIGGIGTYGLSRQIGVSRPAALGAALAFTLGNATYHMTSWMPTVQAPYVLLPVAMWCCERLIQAPSLRRSLLLGLALAAALLPGHPQFVLFTCQLIALRVLWSALDPSERPQFWGALGGIALAGIVMLLLTAVQYLSSLEVIGESVRRAALRPEEIMPRGFETLSGLGQVIRRHESIAVLSIVPGFLSVAALAGSARRRIALFYVLAGLLFFALSLGHATPIGALYFQLPFSGLFRQPMRFRFVTTFCSVVLTGLAIDVLAQGSWRGLLIAVASLAGLYLWLGGFWPADWWLAGPILIGALFAAALPSVRPLALGVILGGVVAAPLVTPSWTTQRFLADDRPLRVHTGVFTRLQGRMTAQDRVQFVLPETHEARFQDKTAMLYRVPTLTDYDLQLTQRYAEYLTMLRTRQPMSTINDVVFLKPWNPQRVSWPLINLAAGRYLIVDKSTAITPDPEGSVHLQFLDDDRFLSVYENPNALPRAYYVPQLAVEPDWTQRLIRLAGQAENPRRVALVESAPASGFLGVAGNEASADAQIVVNDPEHVVIDTVAPERGFLFLADQYFPAWSATVNGEDAPILVGNHAFRLVEVPKGPVRVEFTYSAWRLRVGALISGATLLLVLVLLVFPRRRPSVITADATAANPA